MADFDLNQTGQEVQEILDGAAMQTDLTAETERAELAEQTLQGGIDAEETRAKAAEKQNADDIDLIEAKIPAGASSENQLADKQYVNNAVATASATYRGAFNLVSDLSLTTAATHAQIATALAGAIDTADNNDYCFVQIPTTDATPTQIASIERYKFNGTAWAYEYTLNNSGFTAAQWAALNSGITSGLVAKLSALPTNEALTLTLAGKQDVLTFDSVPVDGSNNPVKSGGIYSAIGDESTRAKAAEKANADDIDDIEAMIPTAASDDNQLADKQYVNDGIATASATYRGSFNEVSDLSLTIDATHAQIAAALAGAISTAANNDYCFVQIPTADATPTQIAAIERYKFNGSAWAYEYTLNNSGFTADQWAALNSGITSGLVAKLSALPTNDALTLALAGKQDVMTFDNVPTSGSSNPVKSGGVYSAIDAEATTRAAAIAAIIALIPEAASALNQLADKAFVNSSISTATAIFKGTFNVVVDLELNYNASQQQIATMLASKIISADNNDYCFVQIPTSNETPLQIARTDRYKFNGTAWAYEYTLNNSGFTAAQWAAINSGITSLLKDKLIDLPTATELTTLLAAKQNTLTFDTTPTTGSTNPVTSGGIKSAIDAEKARAEAAEADRYTKSETYNKTEIDGLVSTPHQNYVTVDAYASLPSSGQSTDTIYRVSSYDGVNDQVDDTVYSEYAWDGTQYVFLCVKSQIEEVFDITVYNSGTKYADLSAALGVDGANIPATLRRGGMSVKYVCSSDNKYVQYRLMATSFSTTESDWQGVDDEIIAGSKNLAESGAVERTNYELLTIIGNIVVYDGNFTKQAEGWDEQRLFYNREARYGDSITIHSSNSTGEAIKVRATYSDNTTEEKNIYSGNRTNTFSKIGCTVKGLFFYFSSNTNPNGYLYIEAACNLQQQVDNILPKVKDDFIAKSLFDIDIVQGKTINGTNGYYVTDASSTLGKLEIIGGRTYQPIIDQQKPTSYRIAFYEDAEATESKYISGTNNQTGAFTTPSNAKSCVIAYYQSIFTALEVLDATSFLNTWNNQFDNIPIGGSNALVKSGVIKTAFDSHALFDYIIEQDKTINGTNGNIVSDTGSTIAKTTITGGKTYQPLFDGVKPKGTTSNPDTYRIAFYSNYDYTGYIDGTNVQNGTFTTPSNAKSIIVSSYHRAFQRCEFVDVSSITSQIPVISDSLSKFLKPYTATKNVLWIGTSIPEGCTYPQKSCEANGLNCINKSLGSSGLCFFNTHPETVTVNSGKKLTATVAELEALYREDVTQGVITEATLTLWKNYSYENSIIPYIDGTNDQQVSMIVLDHGYNDRSYIKQQLENEASIDYDSDNRETFTGAFRYLIDKIQSINPFVKIVICGYITDKVDLLVKASNPSVSVNTVRGKAICRMQTLLSEHYDISIMKAWEHSQIGNYYIAGSSSYISDFNQEYSKNYELALIKDENGNLIQNPNNNISSFQLYCMDCVHPFTDLTGHSNARLNAIYSKLLARMI